MVAHGAHMYVRASVLLVAFALLCVELAPLATRDVI